MNQPFQARRAPALLSALTLSLLAACGGGGSSTDDSAGSLSDNGPATLTASNAEDAARAALVASSVGDLSSGMSSAVLASGGSQVAGIARQAHALALAAQAGRRRAAATETVTCSGGGSMSIDFADSDGDGVLDVPGESVTIDANSCHLGDSAVVDGVMTLSLTRYTSASSYGFQMSFSSFAARDLGTGHSTKVSGSLSSAFSGGDTLVVTASSLTATSVISGSSSAVSLSDFRLVGTDLGSSTSATINGTIVSSALGSRSVSLTTLTPFVTAASSDYPSSGQMKITGASGSVVLVNVLDDTQVEAWVDTNGDGSYESSQTYNWSDLQ